MGKILLFFIFTFSLNSFSQKNIIKTNPVGYFFEIYNISYERETIDKQSISLSLYDYNFSNYNGYAVNSEYRFYLNNKPGLEGFFISPSFLYSELTSESTDFNKQDIYSINFNLGNQWILDSKLTFDYSVGLGYLKHNDHSGTGIIASFSIGYAF